MAHILIIEDDPDLGPRLSENLELEGYRVTLVPNGRSGLSEARKGTADLIVLDLMLPLMDGLHILKLLRHEMIQTPVIILTARCSETQRLDGFRAGCDDYVAKPFSLMELFARVRAVLRRSGFREVPSVLNSNGLVIDPSPRIVTLNGSPLILTPREFDLLYALVSHAGRTLSRSALLDEVWGSEADVTGRTVDTHISSLRRKIETDPDNPRHIVTVYKAGYRWDPD